MADLEITTADIPDLTGKTVIVTGGSSGIGLAAATSFSKKGANVVIADLSPPKQDASNIRFVRTDVASWDSLVALFDTCGKEFGSPDIVFANAGIRGREDTFSDVLGDDGKLKEPDYKTLSVNLVGVLNTVKLAIHHMRKGPTGGAIVVTASKAAYSATGGPIYATSKHALLGMMRALKRFLPAYGIRLNCIAPGLTDTGIFTDEVRQRLIEAKMVIQPAETVALAVLFLATNQGFHARTIQIIDNKFREIEAGYEAASMLMFGDDMGGRSSLPPEGIKIMQTMFETVV